MVNFTHSAAYVFPFIYAELNIYLTCVSMYFCKEISSNQGVDVPLLLTILITHWQILYSLESDTKQPHGDTWLPPDHSWFALIRLDCSETRHWSVSASDKIQFIVNSSFSSSSTIDILMMLYSESTAQTTQRFELYLSYFSFRNNFQVK